MDAVVILGLAGILTVPPWVALMLGAVQVSRTARTLISALAPAQSETETDGVLGEAPAAVLRRFVSPSPAPAPAPAGRPPPVVVPAPQIRRSVPAEDRGTDPSEEMTDFELVPPQTDELPLDDHGNPPPVPR